MPETRHNQIRAIDSLWGEFIYEGRGTKMPGSFEGFWRISVARM